MDEVDTHPVARAILERRSWRVYTGDRLRPEEAEALQAAAGAAPSIRGLGSARLHLATDAGEVAALTRAITGGFLGKGNLWLRSGPPGAYAVLVADAERGARVGDRHLFNADAAVLGELLALTATSLHLGSCWMAAIDARSISRALDLGPTERVPAVLAAGEPGFRKRGSLLAAGFDRLARRAISGRRKPLDELVSAGRFGVPLQLPPPDLGSLPADGRALGDVLAGLGPSTRFAGEPPTRADLGLVLESMRLAPSADNAQTWRFVALEGRAETARLLEAAGLPVDPGAAPGLAVVLLAAPFVFKQARREEPFALIDHPIALTHAVLVADLLGLRWAVAMDFRFDRVGARVGAPGRHEVTAILLLDRGGAKAADPAEGLSQLHL